MKVKLLEAYEIPSLYRILLQPKIAFNLTSNPFEVTENTLASFLLKTNPGTVSEAFSVYLKDDLVGVITINNICRLKNSAFIGVIALDQKGKEAKMTGLGIKVGKWVLKYCFNILNLNRVYGHTWADNPKMDTLYKKVGATHEGTEREHTWKNGKYVDMKVWSILRSEWKD